MGWTCYAEKIFLSDRITPTFSRPKVADRYTASTELYFSGGRSLEAMFHSHSLKPLTSSILGAGVGRARWFGIIILDAASAR